jgi:hypothetical protein
MNKYDPLREFLRRQDRAELDLSFEDVEAIIGRVLPPSADSPRWWSNVRHAAMPHVQRRAWHDAGYRAFPRVGQERVVFRRRAAGLEQRPR